MVALSLVVVGVLAAAAAAGGAPPPARIGVVCPGANGPVHGGTVRPTTIMLACADGNLWIGELRWKGWGTATVTAAGTVHYNDCTPYCAAGHFHTAPGTATLSGLRIGSCFRLTRVPVYTRLRVVATGRGKHLPPPVSESLPAHC